MIDDVPTTNTALTDTTREIAESDDEFDAGVVATQDPPERDGTPTESGVPVLGSPDAMTPVGLTLIWTQSS